MQKTFSALIAGALAMTVTHAWADGGHAHGSMSIGKPGKAQQARRTVEVTMNDEMRFTPAKIDVTRGETVRFVVRNLGQMKHEFMLGTAKELKEHAAVMQKHPEMEHDEPNAISVEPGQSGEVVWQFTNSDSFMFGCLVPGHYESGMVGQLQVRQAKVTPTNTKAGK